MKRTFITAAIVLTALSGAARQPERGYRGFVDWTNRIHRSSYYGGHRTNYDFGISTSHGYQFNPWLFAGVGIDVGLKDTGWWSDPSIHHYDLDNNFISIFAEGRADLKLGKFTPFADVRLGWNACENGTIYFSPSIGYRFNWGRKVGINVGIGYTLDGYRYENYIEGQTPEGITIYVPTGEYSNWSRSAFSFRVGVDF